MSLVMIIVTGYTTLTLVGFAFVWAMCRAAALSDRREDKYREVAARGARRGPITAAASSNAATSAAAEPSVDRPPRRRVTRRARRQHAASPRRMVGSSR